MRIIAAFHHFLERQLFYPLVLSTVLALIMYLGRVFQSDNWHIYLNLIWNLFLAWLPYLFAFAAAALHSLFSRQWWLLIVPAALWLLFFPNASYIVTDFLHLRERPYVPLWYDILLLATFSWTGIFLAVASLRTMQLLVRAYLGGIFSWLFVFIALGLNGLGLYLGRFERWNSWDVLTHPEKILADIAVRFVNPTENLRFFGFTLLFSAFLLVCYLMFVSVHKEEPQA